MGRGKKFFIISIGVLLTLCFIYRLEFYKSIPSGQMMWNVQDPEQDEQSIFPIADVDPIRKTLYIAMDNNTIKALNVSGKEKWNIQLNEQCLIKNIKVCPDGNVLIISDNKPFLTKINPDGQILYQSSTESNINGISASDTPKFDEKGNFYLISSGGDVIAFSKECKVIWSKKLSKSLEFIEIGDTAIYVGTFMKPSKVWAIDYNGKILWEYSKNPSVIMDLAVNKNEIYLSCMDSELIQKIFDDQIDKETANPCNVVCLDDKGKEKWTSTIPGAKYGSDDILYSSNNNSIYVIGFRGDCYNLCCFDTEGRLKWNTENLYNIDPWWHNYSFIVDKQGNIYLGTFNNNLIKLDKNGNKCWMFTSIKKSASGALPIAIDEVHDIVFVGMAYYEKKTEKRSCELFAVRN